MLVSVTGGRACVSLLGMLLGLGLLIVLTLRGASLFIATPLCALVVALTSGLPLLPPLAAEGQTDLISGYMGGFTRFIRDFFFIFLLGAVFGKLMEASGAADSVAQWITRKLGVGHAALAVVLACAALTYGGVSLFVVAFSVYPMAVALFRQADLPRRFIPAALGFGSVTFTMTSAGSPEIQNWIPMQYLGTTPMAAWQASLIVALAMAVSGHFWLSWMLKRAVAAGERFEGRDQDPVPREAGLPHPLLAAVPLVAVLVVSNWLQQDLGKSALILAMLAGCLAAAALMFRTLKQPGEALSEGGLGALIAIGNTAAVVGFGDVAKLAPAFTMAVDWVTHLPGGGLIAAALAVAVIAALTGSASGGQVIALPILAPIFLAQGVNPEQLHRAVAISSGSLDSLPHNGYVVTTIRAICGETHARAYWAMGALTVIVPLAGLALLFVLFALGL